MSIWSRIGEFLATAPGRALSATIELLRTMFEGDPELRRKVAFSIAMIALSAKMAKADGVVTPDEVGAFHDIFDVPHHEAANVSRLYNLAKADVAGYEHYAAKLAGLCGDGDGGGLILEDILDGLFHIAKADGVIHEREVAMLADIALTFGFSEARFSQILSRHAYGEADPFLTLGVERDAPFAEVRRRYRQLVAENHPDRLIARGVPEEFVAIANSRLAAINAAFESIERAARPA